jgi:hypothetical protein
VAVAVFVVDRVGFLYVAIVGFGLVVVRHSGVGVALVFQPNRASQPLFVFAVAKQGFCR